MSPGEPANSNPISLASLYDPAWQAGRHSSSTKAMFTGSYKTLPNPKNLFGSPALDVSSPGCNTPKSQKPFRISSPGCNTPKSQKPFRISNPGCNTPKSQKPFRISSPGCYVNSCIIPKTFSDLEPWMLCKQHSQIPKTLSDLEPWMLCKFLTDALLPTVLYRPCTSSKQCTSPAGLKST